MRAQLRERVVVVCDAGVFESRKPSSTAARSSTRAHTGRADRDHDARDTREQAPARANATRRVSGCASTQPTTNPVAILQWTANLLLAGVIDVHSV